MLPDRPEGLIVNLGQISTTQGRTSGSPNHILCMAQRISSVSATKANTPARNESSPQRSPIPLFENMSLRYSKAFKNFARRWLHLILVFGQSQRMSVLGVGPIFHSEILSNCSDENR